MNYGIPYMGSKSGIVRLIRYILERHYDKKYFIDVFCGGFAVSHYVLEKSNFKVYANDKNKYVVAFLEKLLYEGLPDKAYDFVSRELFFDVINNPNNYDDWYVGYVSTLWSFGNMQRTYMFGVDVEPIKHSMHKAIIENVWDETVKDIEKEVPTEVKSMDYKEVKGKRLMLMRYAKDYLKRQNNKISDERLHRLQQLQQLERLEQSQRLQQLERLEQSQQLEQSQRLQQLERLERSHWLDFINDIPEHILKDAIIYCDPPYEDTAEYAVDGFNHKEFWDWFRTTPYCVYVSGYKAPDDIKPLNFEFKTSTLSPDNREKMVENIYWNGKGKPIPTMEDLLFGLE